MYYSNSQIIWLITEYVHSERDREILKRNMVDGLTIEKLAEEFNYSPRHMFRIVAKAKEELFKAVSEMSLL